MLTISRIFKTPGTDFRYCTPSLIPPAMTLNLQKYIAKDPTSEARIEPMILEVKALAVMTP
jgi:hypothetical protein